MNLFTLALASGPISDSRVESCLNSSRENLRIRGRLRLLYVAHEQW